MNCLCIDFGSTFVKYRIICNGAIVFRDKLPFPEPCICEGARFEVAVQQIDTLIRTIFQRVKSYAADSCFIAVQMHGYILKNNDGSFSNYVSWKDQTGDMESPLVKEKDFSQNGTSLKTNLPAVKLASKVWKGNCTFFTLGSYIAYKLTGRNITHKTDACASGFYNAETLEPLTAIANLRLPEATHRVLPIGKSNGVEIYTPVGDHQLSFLGSGAENSAYLLNIGTATQLSTLADDGECHKGVEKRPYFHKKRLFTVSGLSGGEKLFAGYDTDAFCQEVYEAVRKLPPKTKMFVGGGGAELVLDQLQAFFEKRNIACSGLAMNISEEGFVNLLKMCDQKIGTMLSEICFPNFPVILKNEHMDFLIVDNEHGAFDYGFLSAIVMNARLVGLPLIVRLPDHNRRDITKLADMGVGGFLLPMTNNAEDIKKVVEFAKYAPVGKRGISTNRAHTFYNPPPIDQYMKTANETMKVFAQIETRQGVENIDDILSVNGVDGVFVGPNDLSCDMNCVGNSGPVKEVLKVVSAAAEKHGKAWGIITTSKELISCSLKNGVDYISYGSEINMLKDACKGIRGNICD